MTWHLTLAAIFFSVMASAAPSDRYRLIVVPDPNAAPLYDFLASAKKSIDITMYALDDSHAQQLLARAAVAGVKVRVILDQNRQKRTNQAAFDYLSAHGVAVHWANPAYPATHQKTITVDGVASAIMTCDLTSVAQTTHRDFIVTDSDPKDVAAIEKVFAADFLDSPVTPVATGALVWSPGNARAMLMKLITSARDRLSLETEEMSESELTEALVKASSREVFVKLTMTNVRNRYSAIFNELVDAGADVSTYSTHESLYIHAKAILSDFGDPAARLFIGSQDLSDDSLARNRELGIVVSDPAIITAAAATLSGDFDDAKPWRNHDEPLSLLLLPPAAARGARTR
jgi:cardiolipin synthase